MRKNDRMVLRHTAAGSTFQAQGMPWPQNVDMGKPLDRETVSGMFKKGLATSN